MLLAKRRRKLSKLFSEMVFSSLKCLLSLISLIKKCTRRLREFWRVKSYLRATKLAPLSRFWASSGLMKTPQSSPNSCKRWWKAIWLSTLKFCRKLRPRANQIIQSSQLFAINHQTKSYVSSLSTCSSRRTKKLRIQWLKRETSTLVQKTKF